MAYPGHSTNGRILNLPVRTAAASMKCKLKRIKFPLLTAVIAGGSVFGTLLMLLSAPVHIHFGAGLLPGRDHTEGRRQEVQVLSAKPRAYYFKKFLSDAECDYLIQLAAPNMQESRVVDRKTGGTKRSASRTSTGTFLPREPDAVVKAIEQRVAEVTMVPIENQEAFYILHYHDGQKYEPHMDFFSNEEFIRPESGGQRVVTVLMYLSTPDEGGETVFPDAERKVTGPDWSDCARQGLAAKAKKGDALVFWSLRPDGELDPTSLHGSCPTLKGDKWTATKWIHVLPYPGAAAKKSKHGAANECLDERESCSKWAAKGECDNNSAFMLKHCRASCGLCKPAPAERT